MARLDDLRSDYEALGVKLAGAEGSGAAALVRERRIIGDMLYQLEKTEGGSVVDQLAKKRADSGARRPPSRRRKSG